MLPDNLYSPAELDDNNCKKSGWTPESLQSHSRVTPKPSHSRISPGSLQGLSQITLESLMSHLRVNFGHFQVTIVSHSSNQNIRIKRDTLETIHPLSYSRVTSKSLNEPLRDCRVETSPHSSRCVLNSSSS